MENRHIDFDDVRARRGIAAWLDASGARVLLAEDDDEMRDALAATLRARDCYVTEVSSSDELASAVDGPDAARRFDLIVADVRMPGGSGVDLLEQLRIRGVRVPIVLMTGYAPAALRDRAIRLGSTVLEKPFDLRSFDNAVERALVGRTPVHLSMPWGPP